MTKRIVIGSACLVAGEPVAIGEVLEMEDSLADQLIAMGRAELAPPPPAVAPEPTPAPRRASKPAPKPAPQED